MDAKTCPRGTRRVGNKCVARVKYLSVEEGEKLRIGDFPNFHKSGSITGMKKKYYGEEALLVRSGNYIYNVTAKPSIYRGAH